MQHVTHAHAHIIDFILMIVILRVGRRRPTTNIREPVRPQHTMCDVNANV